MIVIQPNRCSTDLLEYSRVHMYAEGEATRGDGFWGRGGRTSGDWLYQCASGSLVTLSTDVPQAWGLFKIDSQMDFYVPMLKRCSHVVTTNRARAEADRCRNRFKRPAAQLGVWNNTNKFRNDLNSSILHQHLWNGKDGCVKQRRWCEPLRTAFHT